MPHFGHVVSVDLAAITTTTGDITSLSAAEKHVILGLSTGRVLLCSWDGGLAVDTPQLRHTWCLPERAGLPSVLAAFMSAPAEVSKTTPSPGSKRTAALGTGNSVGSTSTSSVVLLVGTQAGLLLQGCSSDEETLVLSSPHEGNPVNVLLLGPEVEVLELEPDILREPENRSNQSGAPVASSNDSRVRRNGGAGAVGLRRMLFSGDAAGRVFRSLIVPAGTTASSGAPELCAELNSPVLALSLCDRSGRLLVSTAERIFVIDEALDLGSLTNAVKDDSARVRIVGSKGHKGQFTATFSTTFGPDALIAARPGGRLWVAEAVFGAVHQTLIFKGGAGGEDKKASLNRLVRLGRSKVVSWSRTEQTSAVSNDATNSGTAVTLLDLESIAVCSEWSLAPVVDVVPWGEDNRHLILAHRASLSAILLFDSSTALINALLADGGVRLRGNSKWKALQEVLGQIEEHRTSLMAASAPSALLSLLRPIVTAILAISTPVEISVKDTDGAEPPGLLLQQLEHFKRWVSELEDKAVDDIRATGAGPAISLSTQPLSNFPVAEGTAAFCTVNSSGIDGVGIPVATLPHNVHEADVVAISEFFSPGDHADESDTVSNSARRQHLTPQMLRHCQAAMMTKPIAEPMTGMPLSAIPRLPSKQTAPAPVPNGIVQCALRLTPFHTGPEILRFMNLTLLWLVRILERRISEPDINLEDVMSVAAVGFEMLCVHTSHRFGSPGTGSNDACTKSSWPCLRLLGRARAPLLEKPDSVSNSIDHGELARHLRTLAAAALAGSEAGSSGQPLAAKDAPEKIEHVEPWATVAAEWTPDVALAYCDAFLIGSLPHGSLDAEAANSKGDRSLTIQQKPAETLASSSLEHCLLRANGLVGGAVPCHGEKTWLDVVVLLLKRISIVSPDDALAALSSAAALTSSTMGGQSSCGQPTVTLRPKIAESERDDVQDGVLHAGLANSTKITAIHAGVNDALQAITCSAASGLSASTSRILVDLRKVIQYALAHFPALLPWNIDAYIQSALEAMTKAKAASKDTGPSASAAILRRRSILSEIFAGEFLQYLLRLLPTCALWQDGRSLLECAISTALHGYRGTREVLELHNGRCAVVDALIDRYYASLTPKYFSSQLYPLGVLKVLQKNRREKDISKIAEPSASEHDEAWFDEMIATLLGVFSESHIAPAHMARAHNSYQIPTTGVAQGDFELARELWQICNHSNQRWTKLLATVSEALHKEMAASECSATGVVHAGRSLERLLAALATVCPGPEAASACMRAADGGSMSEAAVKACIEPLWAVAASLNSESKNSNQDAGPHGLARSSSWNQDIGFLLALPVMRSAPAPPDLTPRPLAVLMQASHITAASTAAENGATKVLSRSRGSSESELRAMAEGRAPKSAVSEAAMALDEHDPEIPAGFYRTDGDYVYVSDDGLHARHLDDSGEDMHGVVLSTSPLEVGHAGLYFEVCLDEVRPEEMPDGLTIGVTATSPASAAWAQPATAEHLPHTWTVGYDGQMWDATSGTLSSVDWDPRCLRQGDSVGVLVTRSEGELLVFHNGVACCPGPRGIPVGLCPLYAVVDLLGAARAVRWETGVRPPIGNT